MLRGNLGAVAAQQGGVFTRAQAAADYSEREIRTRTRTAGPWVTVRRGVYCERSVWQALDEYDGPARLRDRAAHLMMRKEHVLSHDSAARLHGLPLLRPATELAHITRPGVGGSRTDHGVKHHLARLRPCGVTEVDGLPVSGLARTAIDVAREHGRAAGLGAFDAVLRRGVGQLEFREELGLMVCWPHVTVPKWCLEHADDGAESLGESVTRALLLEMGIVAPVTQFHVRTHLGVSRCDLRVGCHVIEFDGRAKYRRRDAGGLAVESGEAVLWEEKRRQDAVCGLGLGMSRVVWSEILGRAKEDTKGRLRAEMAQTAQRFGTELPEHLARFDREMRAAYRSRRGA